MESRPPEALGAVSHVLRPSMARVEICTFAMFCKSFRAVYFFLVSAQCGGAALGRKQRFKLRHYRKAPAKDIAAAPERPASGNAM